MRFILYALTLSLLLVFGGQAWYAFHKFVVPGVGPGIAITGVDVEPGRVYIHVLVTDEVYIRYINLSYMSRSYKVDMYFGPGVHTITVPFPKTFCMTLMHVKASGFRIIKPKILVHYFINTSEVRITVPKGYILVYGEARGGWRRVKLGVWVRDGMHVLRPGPYVMVWPSFKEAVRVARHIATMRTCTPRDYAVFVSTIPTARPPKPLETGAECMIAIKLGLWTIQPDPKMTEVIKRQIKAVGPETDMVYVYAVKDLGGGWRAYLVNTTAGERPFITDFPDGGKHGVEGDNSTQLCVTTLPLDKLDYKDVDNAFPINGSLTVTIDYVYPGDSEYAISYTVDRVPVPMP